MAGYAWETRSESKLSKAFVCHFGILVSEFPLTYQSELFYKDPASEEIRLTAFDFNVTYTSLELVTVGKPSAESALPL